MGFFIPPFPECVYTFGFRIKKLKSKRFAVIEILGHNENDTWESNILGKFKTKKQAQFFIDDQEFID